MTLHVLALAVFAFVTVSCVVEAARDWHSSWVAFAIALTIILHSCLDRAYCSCRRACCPRPAMGRLPYVIQSLRDTDAKVWRGSPVSGADDDVGYDDSKWLRPERYRSCDFPASRALGSLSSAGGANECPFSVIRACWTSLGMLIGVSVSSCQDIVRRLPLVDSRTGDQRASIASDSARGEQHKLFDSRENGVRAVETGCFSSRPSGRGISVASWLRHEVITGLARLARTFGQAATPMNIVWCIQLEGRQMVTS
jgi:hypothetical protein